MTRRYGPEMGTDRTYNANTSFAWSAAAALNVIADIGDPELWQKLFDYLDEREILTEVVNRFVQARLERPPSGPEAA